MDHGGISVFFRGLVGRGNTCVSRDVKLKDLIVTAFKSLKHEPILVLEVNERCRPDDLQNLIVCLKTWYFDKKYAKAALQVKLNIAELRAAYICIGDLATDEAHV